MRVRKCIWILEHVEGAKERAKRGELLFGTVETWLIWKLTKGKVHATDYSNASRTMMFNINTLQWDDEILEVLDIPKCMLPEVRAVELYLRNADPGIFWRRNSDRRSGRGSAGGACLDRPAFLPGEAKNTYGTGCFLLMNTGETPVFSKNGLVTTIAWGMDGKVQYALGRIDFRGGGCDPVASG